MTRREAIVVCVGLPLAAAVSSRKAYGYLDVDTALARGYLPARVFLDGVEIDDVRELNDAEGWLIRYRRDAYGSMYTVAPDEPAMEKLFGKVTYVPNPNGKPGVWA